VNTDCIQSFPYSYLKEYPPSILFSYRVPHNFPFTTIPRSNLANYTPVKMKLAIHSSLKTLHYQSVTKVMARLQKYCNVTNMAARACMRHAVQDTRTEACPEMLRHTYETPYWYTLRNYHHCLAREKNMLNIVDVSTNTHGQFCSAQKLKMNIIYYIQP
jgi:hypothetical protein